MITTEEITRAGWTYENQGRDSKHFERWKRYRSRKCPALIKLERWSDASGAPLATHFLVDGRLLDDFSSAVDALNGALKE